MTSLRFITYGLPGPQGSKAMNRHRGMREMSRKVKPWRAAVEASARLAFAGQEMITDPVHLYVIFSLRAPQKMPPGRWIPSTTPDLSKLLRSTEDAITYAGVWRDDALVVVTTAQKLYAGQVGALDQPGAEVMIEVLTPEALERARRMIMEETGDAAVIL